MFQANICRLRSYINFNVTHEHFQLCFRHFQSGDMLVILCIKYFFKYNKKSVLVTLKGYVSLECPIICLTHGIH